MAIGGQVKNIKDRAKEWLNEKTILESNPEAIDSVYIMEEYEILLVTAADIFKEVVDGQ
jgi:hypothetical protein